MNNKSDLDLLEQFLKDNYLLTTDESCAHAIEDVLELIRDIRQGSKERKNEINN
jgi:hypothetical protein